MKTREVTKMLSINRERLKYYKRENLLRPEDFISGDQSDYSEIGIQHIKQIEVLTKYGLTAGYIRKIESGELSLQEALDSRIRDLSEQIEKSRKCIMYAEEMRSAGLEYQSFPFEYYWAEIQRREKQGEEFMGIYEYNFRDSWFRQTIECPFCSEIQEVDLEDYLSDETCNEERSENGMGPDIVYEFDSEGNHECCHCKKIFRITGWLREYPIGAYDSDDIKAAPYLSDDEEGVGIE